MTLSRISKLSVSPHGADLLNAIERNRLADQRPVVCLLPVSRGVGATTAIREVFESAHRVGRKVLLISLDHQTTKDLPDGFPMAGLEQEVDRNPSMMPVECPAERALILRPEITDSNLMLELTATDIRLLAARGVESFDLVLFDAPPLLGSNLAQAVCAVSNQTYLVVRQELTSRGELEAAVARARYLGVEPAGVVYNGRRFLVPQAVYGLFFGGRR